MCRSVSAALLSLLVVGGATAQEPSIRDLDWLIGHWTFEDAAIEGEYREIGTRVCTYTLGGDYIVCESHGTNHRGRERTYLWYLNYNPEDARFEITTLLQGYPRKLLYTAILHDAGHRLEITGGAWEGDGIVVGGGTTVTYDGASEYVWETARFRDRVTRVTR